MGKVSQTLRHMFFSPTINSTVQPAAGICTGLTRALLGVHADPPNPARGGRHLGGTRVPCPYLAEISYIAIRSFMKGFETF